jgi:muramoyltetrapeptide carboxypeptidase
MLPPLRPGDPVGVIAPASAAREPDEVEAGIDRLEQMGYRVRRLFAPDRQRGYLSAPDADRLAALNRALAASDLRALFCVRGGYGSLRLLRHLDYEAARKHPKLLIGYSDITALQWALWTHAGWPSLSSLVVTEWGRADDDSTDHFRRWVEGDSPNFTAFDGSALAPLSFGQAEAVVLGGNLAVLTRLIGTPHMPDLRGALLYLEEVQEAPYRVDRMLAHLDLASVLSSVAGVVLGRFTTPDDVNQPSLTLDDVFADYFSNRPYPVATGLRYGHCLPRLSMPQGIRARLDVTAEGATLAPLEPLTGPPAA